jgi:transposase
MSKPIPLRPDFDAPRLRQLARESQEANQVRRLLALAAIYEGASRTEAAEIGGVTLQVVRDWVVRFNAHGPDGLIDRKAPNQPARLNAAHRAALAAMTESGPIPAVHGVVRWRIIDLCQWLRDEFHVSVSEQTLSRELCAMNYRKLSARPRHHAQAAGAIEDFKKKFPAILDEIARAKRVSTSDIEILCGWTVTRRAISWRLLSPQFMETTDAMHRPPC